MAESTQKNHTQRQNPQQKQDQRHEYANGITLWNPGIRKVPQKYARRQPAKQRPKCDRRAQAARPKQGPAEPIPSDQKTTSEVFSHSDPKVLNQNSPVRTVHFLTSEFRNAIPLGHSGDKSKQTEVRGVHQLTISQNLHRRAWQTQPDMRDIRISDHSADPGWEFLHCL